MVIVSLYDPATVITVPLDSTLELLRIARIEGSEDSAIFIDNEMTFIDINDIQAWEGLNGISQIIILKTVSYTPRTRWLTSPELWTPTATVEVKMLTGAPELPSFVPIKVLDHDI
ncbi:MAG: hypothetical protein AMJ92_04595 [candidate division Zixibacteria bacterium SM23_81]|nr:MAG: hypothetical protein AMJ92_04595 [candidate division Zixibacteria bacterium SM23_81]